MSGVGYNAVTRISPPDNIGVWVQRGLLRTITTVLTGAFAATAFAVAALAATAFAVTTLAATAFADDSIAVAASPATTMPATA